LHGALSQQLRNALIPILTGIHLVEDRIAETMAEIGIHYRRSSIVSGKAGHAIHAGDRAPDCEFQLVPPQEPLRLFDLLRKPVHHLLFFADADADIASTSNALRLEFERDFQGVIDAFVVIRGTHADFSNVLLDWDGEAHTLYEAEPGAIVLIRPDGYIGFRGGPRHTEALREHLAQIFSG
jgi:hypothetical protein